MKLFLSAICLALSLSATHAQTTISSQQSGNWSATSTWDLGRLPHDGDIIVVQPAHTLTLDQSVRLSNVVLRFNGIIQLNARSSMTLNSGSIINIMDGGILFPETTTGDAWISLGGVMKYRSSKTFNASWGVGKVIGVAYATGTSGNVDQGGQGFIFGTLPAVWQDLQLFRTPENFVQMVWVTSHESTARTFHVERSINANQWESIGTIYSTGRSEGQIIYSFMDVQPGTGTIYYRVGQEDADGMMKMSPVRFLKLEATTLASLNAHPNPTKGLFQIPLPEALRTTISFDVTDIQGRILVKGIQTQGSTRVEADISSAPPGVYLIRLHYPDGELRNSRVVKY